MNTGGRWGGASTAAVFLKEFVEDTPWLHLDIAGTAWIDENKSWIAKGPSASPCAAWWSLCGAGTERSMRAAMPSRRCTGIAMAIGDSRQELPCFLGFMRRSKRHSLPDSNGQLESVDCVKDHDGLITRSQNNSSKTVRVRLSLSIDTTEVPNFYESSAVPERILGQSTHFQMGRSILQLLPSYWSSIARVK